MWQDKASLSSACYSLVCPLSPKSSLSNVSLLQNVPMINVWLHPVAYQLLPQEVMRKKNNHEINRCIKFVFNTFKLLSITQPSKPGYYGNLKPPELQIRSSQNGYQHSTHTSLHAINNNKDVKDCTSSSAVSSECWGVSLNRFKCS